MTIEPLYQYFEQKSGLPLTDEEKSHIESGFRLKKLRKKQYLQQEGDICKQMGFVIKGAARMFSVDDKGHEHILRFGMEGWWVGDYESYILEEPTKFNVEMLEDSDLLIIHKEQMMKLTAAIPAVAETIRVIDKRNLIVTQQRIHAALSQTAEERYESLIKDHSDFLQRFPQNMIASYLGITPESLSRIRKKMADR
jgi:CRP-like cAMP-binding protein